MNLNFTYNVKMKQVILKKLVAVMGSRWTMWLLIVLLFSSCAKKEDNVVVHVKNQKLTKDTFLRRYKLSKDYKDNAVFTEQIIKKFVDKNFVGILLITAAAYDEKFDRSPAIVDKLSVEKKKLLTRINGPLYKHIIKDGFDASEEEVKKLYDKSDVQIKIAQIIVSTKILADSLYNLLQHGADFAKLAAQYSLDFHRRENGGVIKQFITRGTLDEEFENTAFSLKKDEISKPIRSSYGYHLVKLVEKKKVKKPSFEQLRPILMRKLKNRKVNLYTERYIQDLFKKYHLTINRENAGILLRAYTKTDINPNSPEISFQFIDEKEAELPLGTYDGGQWTIKDFIMNYNYTSVINRVPLKRYDDVANFVNRQIVRDIMYQEALRLKLDQDKSVKEAFQRSKDLIVYRDYEKKKMYENVTVKQDEMKAFYDANKAKYNNRPYDEVKQVIYQKLRREKAKKRYDSVIEGLKKKYKVVFHGAVMASIAKELNELKKSAPEKKNKK